MKRFIVFCVFALLASGCGEESQGTESNLVLPPLNYAGYAVGELALDAPVDNLDLAVLAGRPELIAKINQSFNTLALNLTYVDLRFTAGCLDIANDAYRLPALARAALDSIRERGVTLEQVAVNVELLTPSRLPSVGSDVPVLGLCGSNGEGFPTFASPEHRSQLKADFSELAELPGLTRLTVGVDMNALYHAGDQGEFGFDYSNYVTIYHEIYETVKAKNSNIAVGPGLSYRVFQLQTVPFAAAQVLQLENCTAGDCQLGGNEPSAVYEAYQLVVAPLLTSGAFGMAASSADFVNWNVIPASANAPFEGSPSFDEVDGTPSAQRRQQILDYFKPLLYVASWTELPYGVQHSDWTGSRGKIDKAVFLDTMLTSLSPILPQHIGWRRFTDLPRDEIAGAGTGNSICSQVVNPGRPEFKRPEDYCSAGLVDSNGSMGSYGTDTILERLTQTGD